MFPEKPVVRLDRINKKLEVEDNGIIWWFSFMKALKVLPSSFSLLLRIWPRHFYFEVFRSYDCHTFFTEFRLRGESLQYHYSCMCQWKRRKILFFSYRWTINSVHDEDYYLYRFLISSSFADIRFYFINKKISFDRFWDKWNF